MGELSPTEAANALRELEAAEEVLSQRTGGITTMMWGIISAAIFLVYGVAERTLIGPQNIAMSFLWLPFVAAGTLLTRKLWQHNALALGQDDQGSVWETIAYCGGFLIVAAVLFLVTRAIGIVWDVDGMMTTVNGLLAGTIAFGLRRHNVRGWTHLLNAGIAMVLGGILLGILELRIGLDVLTAAAICGVSWFTAGFALHQQG